MITGSFNCAWKEHTHTVLKLSLFPIQFFISSMSTIDIQTTVSSSIQILKVLNNSDVGVALNVFVFLSLQIFHRYWLDYIQYSLSDVALYSYIWKPIELNSLLNIYAFISNRCPFECRADRCSEHHVKSNTYV